MILPIRTSIRPRRTPYVNYALIVINVLIFSLQFFKNPVTGNLEFRPWVFEFMLTPARPHMWQFVTYAFLHGGRWHIIGNMFFLYLFGNNVNDKLGTVGYVCFYLAGAVFSGIGHTLFSLSPVLGASGAVAAVTGAYLVLFPQTLITVIYFFIFIGTMEVPALYFIAFKLIFIDNIIAGYTDFVAYDAHLAGYAFGIATMLGMLAAGLIVGSGIDLWTMIKQWNRRRRYNDVVSSGYEPFAGQNAKRIKDKQTTKADARPREGEKINRLRTEIGARIAQRNLPAATVAYLELMKLDSGQLLPRQYLLDVANQLASENEHTEAAHAYEKFLTHYRNYEYTEQVELMLGILYSRYLEKPQLAAKHLQAALQKLSDQGQKKMCQDELAQLPQ